MKLAVFSIIAFLFLSCDRNMVISGKVSSLPITAAALTSTVSGSQVDSLDIEYQVRGFCYAYSSQDNAIPSNGEAHSSNVARKIDSRFPDKGFYMVLNEKENMIIDNNFLGAALYLVNTTGNAIQLQAQDSRLDIIPEAKDKKGEWKSIGYLPSSWCGNSYHTVTLGKDEYWKFEVPVFKGTTKTKLRYVLLLENGKKLYSNEVDAWLNPGQFDPSKKEGYEPENIMDPYND